MQQADRWTGSHAGLGSTSSPVQIGFEATSIPAPSRLLDEGMRQAAPEDEMQRLRAVNIDPYSGTGNSAHSVASLIHDARNMVSAMDLYCDLLAEPGVLTPSFAHYAGELRLVSSAGRRLLEELAIAESLNGLETGRPPQVAGAVGARMQLEPSPASGSMFSLSSGAQVESAKALREPFSGQRRKAAKDLMPKASASAGRRKIFPDGLPITSLAEELRANRSLLTALVGPRVTVDFSISDGQRPIAMTPDDLTRVLVNLARNAADAMPRGGHLQIVLEEGSEYISLVFMDNGPGIPEAFLEAVFTPGFSTYTGAANSAQQVEFPAEAVAWPVQHRGLGLSIVRSIIAAAGGSIWAANRNGLTAREILKAVGYASFQTDDATPKENGELHGAVLVIEFPLLDPGTVT